MFKGCVKVIIAMLTLPWRIVRLAANLSQGSGATTDTRAHRPA